MEINKKDIEKWCKALRSGTYSQTRNSLQNRNGYCCLGVACELFISEDQQVKQYNRLKGSMPAEYQTACPIWLKNIDIDFKKRTDTDLVSLNDDDEMSFDEIADCLEAVYILEVLK